MLDNVIPLLHIGSATIETCIKMALIAVENLSGGSNGEILTNRLNCADLYGI